MHNTHYHVFENYSSSKMRMVAPSEHTIDGTQYALELQVYADQSGGDATATKHEHMIYSILFEADNSAPATTTDAQNIQSGADNWEDRWGALIFGQNNLWRGGFYADRGTLAEIPIGDLLMENVKHEYWNYDGSSTVLPCSQFADVIVSRKTYKVHSNFVTQFTNNYSNNANFGSHGNNRDV